MIAAITWQPGLGDPNLTGWIITIAYGAAAALCFRCGRRVHFRTTTASDSGRERLQNRRIRNTENQTGTPDVTSGDLLATPLAGKPLVLSSFPTHSDHRQALPWFIFAAALLLLGLNKQLDFQTLFLQTGREIALAAGWYGERRRLQMAFVLALGGFALVTLVTSMWKQRSFFWRHPLTLSGSLLLVCYVLLRAAAIDHVDEAAGLSFNHRRLLAGMELSGILCLAAAGFLAAKPPRQTRERTGN